MLIEDPCFSDYSRIQIMSAQRAHASVPPHLRCSDPLLGYTSYEILHQINPNPQLAGRNMDMDQAEAKWFMSDIHRYVISNKLIATEIPAPDDLEVDYRGKWYEGGDHFLLQAILASGRVPLAWGENWLPDSPRSLHQALQVARRRGYTVPDRFLAETNPNDVSFSESEAFYAAYLLVSGNYYGWLSGTSREEVECWRPLVCQLTCQFVIPDPLSAGKTPYIVDQLWIVASPIDLKVRLLAVEIDGEVHLGEAEQARSKRRDAMLLAMGYEVYHLAGWWCRVDPFRAICRFLEASRLTDGLARHLRGGHLNSIDQYRCGLCGYPIVRRESDWLCEIRTEESGNYFISHGECARYLSEYLEIYFHHL